MGDLGLIPFYAKQRVKGTLLSARGRYVREEYGEQAFAKLVEAVAPEARQHLTNTPLPFAWYPLETLIEIDRRIIEGPMKGEIGTMKAFGDKIARYDLKTVYKILFKLGSPAFVLRRISTVYGMYLDGGEAQADFVEDRSARLSFRDAYYPHYLCKFGMSGWLSSSVDLSGGRNVQIEHDRCIHFGASRCSWRLDWD